MIIAPSPRFFAEAVGMVLIALLAYYLTGVRSGFTGALPILGAIALGAQRLIPLIQAIFQGWVDTVEKLRKECAAKIRPNAIMSKNRRSMPSQCSYGGLWLLAPQLPRPPKSLFDPQACGPPNFYWSPKT